MTVACLLTQKCDIISWFKLTVEGVERSVVFFLKNHPFLKYIMKNYHGRCKDIVSNVYKILEGTYKMKVGTITANCEKELGQNNRFGITTEI